MITYQAGIRPFSEDDMSSTVNTPNSMNPPRSNGTVNNIPPKETKPANINFDDGEGDANPKPINPAGNVASTVNMVKPSAPTNTNNTTTSNNIANPTNQMNNNPNKRAVGEEVMTKEFKQIVSEYMDIADYKTTTRLYNLDEAEQNTVLLSLTNKL